MSSTINEIIKESFEKLREEHLAFTPDNYSKIFCQVAKSRGVVVEDCQKVTKYINKLDNKLANEVKKLNASSIDQLLTFLVTRLNRSSSEQSEQLIASLTLLSKRVLQAISLLHNKKATTLANASLDRLDMKQDLNSIETIRGKWFDFVSSYDDSFLKKLDKYGKTSKDDVEKMVFDITKILGRDDSDEIYKTVAPLIVAALAPSIASSMNDDLATISYELRSSPESIASAAMQKDIRHFIKKRVELDKAEVEIKISTLDKILNSINKKIFKFIDSSNITGEQVRIIKNDLTNISLKDGSFESVKEKLLNIATSLEHKTQGFSQKMIDNHKTITSLHSRVKKLENALLIARKESKEDFLTSVATKRALNSELKRAEEAFKRYGTDYALCFLDIDHFKVVNDTYGHDAGDVILATLGKILKRYLREVDFVGRYGGEEFLAILPSTDLNHGVHFANKIIEIIENYKFIYKNERIDIKISCGVAQRLLCKSEKDTLVMADKMLYEAKQGGRNQAMPKVK